MTIITEGGAQVLFKFYPESVSKPANSYSKQSDGTDSFVVTFTGSQLASVVDLLRNGTDPIFQYTTDNQGLVFSGPDPAGGGG